MYRGRILFIGQDRAGKTSLKKSLLGLPFDPKEQSTEGIEVDPSMCEIEVDQIKNWRSTMENKPCLSEFSKEISRMLAEKRYHAILSADSGAEEEGRPAGDLMNQVCTFLHTKTFILSLAVPLHPSRSPADAVASPHVCHPISFHTLSLRLSLHSSSRSFVVCPVSFCLLVHNDTLNAVAMATVWRLVLS